MKVFLVPDSRETDAIRTEPMQPDFRDAQYVGEIQVVVTPPSDTKEAAQPQNDKKEPIDHPVEDALRNLWEHHTNSVIAVIVALILFLLFLGIGFWRTLLLLILVGIGLVVGLYLDGNRTVLELARRLFR